MTRFFSLLFVLLFAQTSFAQALYVGSYNIRYHNAGDSVRGDGWLQRRDVLCAQIAFEMPDVFGAQEVLYDQLNDVLQRLPEYDFIGVGRDDGKKAGEYAAIFYQKQKITLQDSGHFWLSETPEKPSLGWDAACIRICTWGKFEDKASGMSFYFFNLHMDHVGIIARREAAKLVVSRIRDIAKDAPVVLTGDFNVDQTNEIYQIFTQNNFLRDSYVVAKRKFAENGTFNSFATALKTDSRIDHVFVSNHFDVERYGVLTNVYWMPEDAEELKGRDAPQEISFRRFTPHLPSDHYPVFVHLLRR